MNAISIVTLKYALPYIKKFKGKIFVIKIGGELVKEKSKLNVIAEDITLLHQVGINIVIVHGGGPQADELSETLGIEPVKINGRRITDDASLEVAKMIFGGKINIEIVSALKKFETKAVGISGVDGNIIRAKKREITKIKNIESGKEELVDFGHVGDILGIDTSLITKLVEEGYVPVISSLGSDEEGNILNINADVVAEKIACALQAEKLIIMTDVPGVLRNPEDNNSLISFLDTNEAAELIKNRIIVRGMLPKVESCILAVNNGVKRAHIINGLSKHALLFETFTQRGTGTMITSAKEKSDYKTKEKKWYLY